MKNTTLRRRTIGGMPSQKFWKKCLPLYLIALLPIVWFICFKYLAMFGNIIAFKDYSPYRGIQDIWQSNFVGWEHFQKFLTQPMFWRAFRNNLIIAFLSFALTYPLQIIFALFLNEITFTKFKKTVQTISYLPYFLSSMVVVSLVVIVLDDKGIINTLIQMFGGETVYFLTEPKAFPWIIAISDCWQAVGWGSVLFIAALTGVDPGIYEAATIDGANRFQRMWHISIPSMYPIISITLIMNVPSLLGASFEKILLLYSPQTMSTGDVLSTYVYRAGFVQQSQSYSTAVGLFISLLSVVLLLGSNFVAKRLGQEGIW